MWDVFLAPVRLEPSPKARPKSVEHKGFRIYATPFSEGGQYQTAGRIEKDFDGETKEHRFIRAEKHPSREDAETFSISKGKQIVDEQGDKIFKS